MATQKKLAPNHHRNYRLAIGLLAVLLVVVGASAFFLKREKSTSDQKLAAEQPAITTKKISKSKPADSIKEAVEEEVTANPTTEKEAETIAPIVFVDTTGWNQINSKDGSYKVSLSSYVTNGACKDNSSVLLVGMIFVNETNEYNCDGITSALTSTSPQLTRIAFGVNSGGEKPADASTRTVGLANGSNANRYEYITNEGGQKYNNIKYISTKNGKNFVAHMRWLTSYNLYSGSDVFTAPPVFDTIAQKTWVF